MSVCVKGNDKGVGFDTWICTESLVGNSAVLMGFFWDVCAHSNLQQREAFLSQATSIVPDRSHQWQRQFEFLPSGSLFRLPPIKTNRYKNSFIPTVISLLNSSRKRMLLLLILHKALRSSEQPSRINNWCFICVHLCFMCFYVFCTYVHCVFMYV